MQNRSELLTIAPVDVSDIPCNLLDTCTYKERTLSFATRVQVPVVPIVDPDAIFKECCYVHRVYADLSSDDEYRNDYSSFYHQRQLANETVVFQLRDLATNIDYDLNDSTYGQFWGFGAFNENKNFSGYRVDWKKVLQVRGAGTYQIRTTVTKIGITTTSLSFVFTLAPFNRPQANYTTRIDIVMNGLLEKTGVDFTGLNWRHSLRVGGFFGRRNPGYEEDNIIRRNFENQQVSMRQTNQYNFQTNLIPNCVMDEIFDFILFANDIYFNDYNLNNTSQNYRRFPVKLGSNEEPTYSNTSRMVQLNMVFLDKFLNNLKRNYR